MFSLYFIIIVIIIIKWLHVGVCNDVNVLDVRVPRRKGLVYHVCQVSCRQRAIVKAVCSPSVSCPSSPSDFIDSTAPGHTAPTILKILSSSHHSNEPYGDESPNLSSSKDRIEAVGHYVELVCEDDIDVDPPYAKSLWGVIYSF